MALMLLADHEARRALRRERLFRDRTNPLDSLTDSEIFTRYRFNRHNIIDLVERVEGDIGRITKVKHFFLKPMHNIGKVYVNASIIIYLIKRYVIKPTCENFSSFRYFF